MAEHQPLQRIAFGERFCMPQHLQSYDKKTKNAHDKLVLTFNISIN